METYKEILIVDTQRDIEAIIEILILVFGGWDRNVNRRLNSVLRDMVDDILEGRERPARIANYYTRCLLNNHFHPPYHIYHVTSEGEIDTTDPRNDQRAACVILDSIRHTLELVAKEHKLFDKDGQFPYMYMPVDNDLRNNPCINLRRFRNC